MPKRSAFRDFISALRKKWNEEFPDVRSVATSFGPLIPKASTFYGGFTTRLGMHIFVNFQHSSKAWQVGSFTINIILSKKEGAPEGLGGPFAPNDGLSFTEGSYRIGCVLSGRDKWWKLTKDSHSVGMETWQPADYDNWEAVLNSAIKDVACAVRAALTKLGVHPCDGRGKSSEEPKMPIN